MERFTRGEYRGAEKSKDRRWGLGSQGSGRREEPNARSGMIVTARTGKYNIKANSHVDC